MTDLIYTGTDLGCTMDHGCTSFRIWAPFATTVTLQLFSSDDAATADATYTMKGHSDGTWTYDGNVPAGVYYTYVVDGTETQDPYSKAVGCNGIDSQIVSGDYSVDNGSEDEGHGREEVCGKILSEYAFSQSSPNPTRSLSYREVFLWGLRFRVSF